MVPNKGRKNVKKKDTPTDTPTEFALGDTVADIQKTLEEKEHRQRDEAEKQQREEREETPQSHTEEGVAKKDKELRGVTVKWTQRLKERWAHLEHNPGTRKDI